LTQESYLDTRERIHRYAPRKSPPERFEGGDISMVSPDCNGGKGETVRGERFVLKTAAGEVLMLRAAE
jgi:hypothetical protein